MVHRHHTGLEILEQVAGPIDGFCSGIGTGGTITGIGEVLKAQNPNIKIWAVEPENAAILAGGTDEQTENIKTVKDIVDIIDNL